MHTILCVRTRDSVISVVASDLRNVTLLHTWELIPVCDPLVCVVDALYTSTDLKGGIFSGIEAACDIMSTRLYGSLCIVRGYNTDSQCGNDLSGICTFTITPLVALNHHAFV